MVSGVEQWIRMATDYNYYMYTVCVCVYMYKCLVYVNTGIEIILTTCTSYVCVHEASTCTDHEVD